MRRRPPRPGRARRRGVPDPPHDRPGARAVPVRRPDPPGPRPARHRPVRRAAPDAGRPGRCPRRRARRRLDPARRAQGAGPGGHDDPPGHGLRAVPLGRREPAHQRRPRPVQPDAGVQGVRSVADGRGHLLDHVDRAVEITSRPAEATARAPPACCGSSSPPVSGPATAHRRHEVVIVGAGMAAARLADGLTGHDVTLLGDEAHAPYNRILLSAVLEGTHDPSSLALRLADHVDLRRRRTRRRDPPGRPRGRARRPFPPPLRHPGARHRQHPHAAADPGHRPRRRAPRRAGSRVPEPRRLPAPRRRRARRAARGRGGWWPSRPAGRPRPRRPRPGDRGRRGRRPPAAQPGRRQGRRDPGQGPRPARHHGLHRRPRHPADRGGPGARQRLRPGHRPGGPHRRWPPVHGARPPRRARRCAAASSSTTS